MNSNRYSILISTSNSFENALYRHEFPCADLCYMDDLSYIDGLIFTPGDRKPTLLDYIPTERFSHCHGISMTRDARTKLYRLCSNPAW